MMVAAIYDTTISLMMEAAEELGEGDFFGDNRGEGGMGDYIYNNQPDNEDDEDDDEDDDDDDDEDEDKDEDKVQ